MAPPAYGVHARLSTTLRTVALTLRSAKLHSAALMLAALLPVAAGATVHVACTPGHLSFGKVLVGQKKTLSATLSNTGSSAIKLLSLQLENSKFAVSGLSFPLVLKRGSKPPNSSVVFAPTSAESRERTIADQGPFRHLAHHSRLWLGREEVVAVRESLQPGLRQCRGRKPFRR